jgi:XTP/dITP diphosphohydrolase
MRVVLATNNVGKLREFQQLLQPLGLVVLPKAQFTSEQVSEDGDSFVANALLKARHAAQVSQLPALADDSGIEVDALQGAPGIYSARYAGLQATDTDNLYALLNAMHAIPDAQRSARYRCALVYVRTADDAAPVICEASWEGRIARVARGEGGFGYDPIFWLPEQCCTAAELSAEQKNHLSHRSQALRLLLRALAATPPC